MENASRALIIAGSVLISLMVIGALLLMFNNLSSYQKTGTQNTREAQVIEFNNQYETYNRNNVRGSDIYSLLSRAVDYNRRKSTAGTGAGDEGQYLAYEPITITCNLESDLSKFCAPTSFNYDSKIRSSYTVSGIKNDFDDFYNTIKEAERELGAESLNNLVIGFSEIFGDNLTSEAQKKAAVNKFNKASKKKSVTDYSDIEGKYKKMVCQYYDYVQFKRAKFDCNNNVEYNQQTGRIIRMEFTFTGDFQ